MTEAESRATGYLKIPPQGMPSEDSRMSVMNSLSKRKTHGDLCRSKSKLFLERADDSLDRVLKQSCGVLATGYTITVNVYNTSRNSSKLYPDNSKNPRLMLYCGLLYLLSPTLMRATLSILPMVNFVCSSNSRARSAISSGLEWDEP